MYDELSEQSTMPAKMELAWKNITELLKSERVRKGWQLDWQWRKWHKMV
jgi:hypothetical protein